MSPDIDDSSAPQPLETIDPMDYVDDPNYTGPRPITEPDYDDPNYTGPRPITEPDYDDPNYTGPRPITEPDYDDPNYTGPRPITEPDYDDPNYTGPRPIDSDLETEDSSESTPSEPGDYPMPPDDPAWA